MVTLDVQTSQLSRRFLLVSGQRWSSVVRIGLACVRTRAASIGWTVKINRSDAHNQSALFRGRARPDGINTPFGRGPHRGYIWPRLPHSFSCPKKSLLCFFVSNSFGVFFLEWSYPCLYFVHSLSHFSYFSILFLFSLFIFKLLEF